MTLSPASVKVNDFTVVLDLRTAAALVVAGDASFARAVMDKLQHPTSYAVTQLRTTLTRGELEGVVVCSTPAAFPLRDAYLRDLRAGQLDAPEAVERREGLLSYWLGQVVVLAEAGVIEAAR